MIRCLAVVCRDEWLHDRARLLAENLNLPLQTTARSGDGFHLELNSDGLCIAQSTQKEAPVRVNFSRAAFADRGRGEALVRAVEGRKNIPRRILDCTAGFGSDSFVLAQAGHQLTLVEQHPDIAAVVGDGLVRAREHPQVAPVVERMVLICEDAIRYLSRNDIDAPDVCYLDPLFPDTGKRALPKKGMQWLRALAAEVDESQLLDAAIARATEKVVVKRPVRGRSIADRKPDYQIETRLLRFDVYVRIA